MDNKWSGELGALKKRWTTVTKAGQGTKKVDNELQKGSKWDTRKKAAMVQKYWTSDKKWARQTHQIQFLVL